MDYQLTVRFRDRNGRPLPGASVKVWVDDVEMGTFDQTEGYAAIGIPDPFTRIKLVASYAGQPTQESIVGHETIEKVFTFAVTGGFSTLGKTIFYSVLASIVMLAIVVLLFYFGQLSGLTSVVLGGILVIATLVLVFVFSKPNPLQAQILRSTFALGAGAIAGGIPGLINVSLNLGTTATITAAGAIAVYVITFFFKPAGDDTPPDPDKSKSGV